MWFFLILLTIVSKLFYYYFLKPLRHWESLGVPQLHYLRAFWNNCYGYVKIQNVAKVFDDLCKSFPDARYFGTYNLFGRCLVVQDVELIKKIVVRDFDHFVDHVQLVDGDHEPLWARNMFSLRGDEWRRMRSTISPAFNGRKMKMMFGLVRERVDNLVGYFDSRLHEDKTNVVINEMKDVFKRFANDVIASVAFGCTCDSLRVPNNEFYRKASDILYGENFLSNIRMYIVITMPRVAKLFNFKYMSKTASSFFWDVIRESMRLREKEGIVRTDMIHLLMNERKNRPEATITDVDITAQALIFFFGGFETVSALMAFASYELALNPDVQTKLQQEIDCTLRKCNGTVTYEALCKMRYMEMVISECFRKWPSLPATDRLCTKTIEIPSERPDEVSLRLNPGDLLWIPIYSIHRNPEVFPDPERFDPERFSEENKRSIVPYSYIPFGSGPRVCIAKQFALMEIKLAFFQILSKFNFVVVERTPIPLVLAEITLEHTAKDGFWLGLQPRNQNLTNFQLTNCNT